MKLESKYKIEKASSNDPTRPVLQTVCIQDGKAIAADGRIMAIVPCEHAESENGKIVPANVIASIRKSQSKSSHIEAELNGEVKATGQNGEGLSFALPEMGSYPNYKAVLPDKDAVTMTISFDAALLSRLADALGATAKDKTQHVTLEIIDNDTAIRVSASANADAFGVLMPVRIK